MCTKEERWTIEDGIKPKEQKILMTGKIKELRELMLEANLGLCGLCGLPIERAVLDHSHKKDGGTGCVRDAICNACNKRIARLENNWRSQMEPLPLAAWMLKASAYIRDHHTVPSKIVHPTERSFTKHKKKKKPKTSVAQK